MNNTTDSEDLGEGTGSPSESRIKHIFHGDIKVKVERIRIEGLGRTKDDFIVKHVSQLFEAETFKDVIFKSGVVKQELEELDMFQGVGVLIDTSKGPKARPDGVDVTVIVKESRRLTGNAHTSVGNNEGSLVLGARCPNLLGRGENLSAEYSRGTRHSMGYNVTFTKPLQGDTDKRLTASVFKTSGDFLCSSYKEIDHGVLLEAMLPSFLGQHNFKWEGSWRDVSCLSRTASFTVREMSGHSVKSSLKHVFTRDTRNERIYPTQGYLFQISQELAGNRLGGDVQFLKGEAEIQLNKKLIKDCVISCSLQAGLMKSLNYTETRINDRFFLGGATSVRGFNFRGLGPHADGDAVGGEAYWAAGLHLFTPLPFMPGRGGLGDLFRTHMFVNAGNLCNLDLEEQNVQQHLERLRDNFRWSYGAGIVLRLGRIARFELNYVIPRTALHSDSINAGLQFGVGVSFL
ncbi:sorting and assembly machinery component 50 homolog A-like isoform X2 [Acanthaster planci]|nr:sorting and assembly machinery component 50 homolog A-like isoform X2 [Acanthaster planci]XP_022083587.1 sorting and assembly machinery component 50 homolog A-like isoform X2 [Acanthaster planci]XP_022083589.1 sorting and assembly machinery component 50 homolog A-like isoform X2 [Acanthaster planci]